MTWRRLGARIRELRDRKHWTREQLAEKTNLSTVYLKKLEAGERVSPSLEALERIARALDATLTVEIKPRRKGGGHGR
jgi:transcriptional regulator with XRE-family HTH domain